MTMETSYTSNLGKRSSEVEQNDPKKRNKAKEQLSSEDQKLIDVIAKNFPLNEGIHWHEVEKLNIFPGETPSSLFQKWRSLIRKNPIIKKQEEEREQLCRVARNDQACKNETLLKNAIATRFTLFEPICWEMLDGVISTYSIPHVAKIWRKMVSKDPILQAQEEQRKKNIYTLLVNDALRKERRVTPAKNIEKSDQLPQSSITLSNISEPTDCLLHPENQLLCDVIITYFSIDTGISWKEIEYKNIFPGKPDTELRKRWVILQEIYPHIKAQEELRLLICSKGTDNEKAEKRKEALRKAIDFKFPVPGLINWQQLAYLEPKGAMQNLVLWKKMIAEDANLQVKETQRIQLPPLFGEDGEKILEFPQDLLRD